MMRGAVGLRHGEQATRRRSTSGAGWGCFSRISMRIVLRFNRPITGMGLIFLLRFFWFSFVWLRLGSFVSSGCSDSHGIAHAHRVEVSWSARCGCDRSEVSQPLLQNSEWDDRRCCFVGRCPRQPLGADGGRSKPMKIDKGRSSSMKRRRAPGRAWRSAAAAPRGTRRSASAPMPGACRRGLLGARPTAAYSGGPCGAAEEPTPATAEIADENPRRCQRPPPPSRKSPMWDLGRTHARHDGNR